MKKFLFILTFLLLACPSYAQTNLKIQWDQSPVVQSVTSYNVYVDAQLPTSVPNTINVTCNCIQVIIGFTTGAHTVKLTALSTSLTGVVIDGVPTPDQTIESSPAIVTFTLNPGGQIKNIKFGK